MAARELVQLRDNWLDPRDGRGEALTDAPANREAAVNVNASPLLQNAHRKLDAAVFAAYGWSNEMSDDEILAKLLALNLERAHK